MPSNTHFGKPSRPSQTVLTRFFFFFVSSRQLFFSSSRNDCIFDWELKLRRNYLLALIPFCLRKDQDNVNKILFELHGLPSGECRRLELNTRKLSITVLVQKYCIVAFSAPVCADTIDWRRKCVPVSRNVFVVFGGGTKYCT